MTRFIEGLDRDQTSLLPACIDDYVDERNPVRAIDAFVDILDLAALGFDVEPEPTGRPGYHPRRARVGQCDQGLKGRAFIRAPRAKDRQGMVWKARGATYVEKSNI